MHTYLASLGIADVESVELIRNPGPEYGTRVDAVLNIITKKKPNEGFNAFLSADISYQALLSVNSRVRLNYNKGNTRNYLAYQYFDNRRKETLTIHRSQYNLCKSLSEAWYSDRIGVAGISSASDRGEKLSYPL